LTPIVGKQAIEVTMRSTGDDEARLGRGLLLALVAVLSIAVLGFHVTGPVNKVAVMANAPAGQDQR
jgi:hypothetical protein